MYSRLLELKSNCRNEKAKQVFREINDFGHRSKFKVLGYEHFMTCFKPAWDIAFTNEHNMAGWRVEGMIPFTRHALWKKIA